DDVEIAEQLERVLAREASFKRLQIDERIDRLQLLCSRIKFLAAHVSRGMDDLALQVSEIDDVKVDDAERAHTRCRKIERQRRSQATGADTQHARSFQLL